MWEKIRKILGVITDLLLIGRNNGWWDEHGQWHEGEKPKEVH